MWCNCSKGTILYFGILYFFWWWWWGVGVGLISFVPQGLSGMGWLHTVNVHAQHAHDCNRFSSIPLTTKKGMQKKKREGM